MIAFLAFAVPLTLYLSIPSCFWNFDGVACAAALELGQRAYLFHSNHLLYGALGFLFWKGIGWPIGIARALPALQLFSSLLASLGLLGLYQTLLPLLRNRWVTCFLVFSLSVTASFWIWSLEAQVYALGFLALAWATFTLLIRDPNPRKYCWVGLLHGGAVLGHLMHALWMIPALYWIYTECRGLHLSASVAIRKYFLFLGLATVLPYAIVTFGVIKPGRDLGRVWIWLKGSAGLTPDRRWAWHSLGWKGPWIWLHSTLPSLWGSFLPYDKTRVTSGLWILTALSMAVFAALLIRGSIEKKDRWGRFAWLWLGVYGLFLSTWEPSTLCYRMTDILPLGILLALGLRGYRSSSQIVLASLLLVSLFTVNKTTLITPMNRSDQNASYQEVLRLSKITSPDSLYVTEGGLLWIYIPYFTGREAWNANSYEPQRLEYELAQQKKLRPVYVQKGLLWEKTR